MKISLVYSSNIKEKKRENRECWAPLGLAYLAAALEKQCHRVQIIDRYLLEKKNNFDLAKTNDETVKTVVNYNTELLGVTATTPEINDALEVCKIIKEYDDSIISVLGGPHVTALPTEPISRCRYVDIGVIGEGEETICEIASGRKISDISGICYKKNGEPIKTNPRPLIKNLDDLSPPAWHLLDMRFYTRPSRLVSRNRFLKAAALFTSRGCPMKCNFCAGPIIFPGVRFHSAVRVIGDIERLIRDYSVRYICFADDMFLANKARAYDILSSFETSGIYKKIKWYAQVRADVVDKELLRCMHKMGCDRVEFGFESGSERVLGLMNKRSSVIKNYQAAYICRQAGISFQGNFIIGYPGETENDILATVKFIKDTRPKVILLNIFWPLPGTTSYNQLVANNKILPSWEDVGKAVETRINYSKIPDERFFELYNRIKLQIVLPNNLFYFIKDTFFHPIVLFGLLKRHFLGYSKSMFLLIMNLIVSKARILFKKACFGR